MISFDATLAFSNRVTGGVDSTALEALDCKNAVHSVLDAANAGTAAQSFLKGDITGGLNTLSSAFKTNKDQMIRIGAGALAAKLVVGSLGGSKVLGAIGPLKLRA